MGDPPLPSFLPSRRLRRLPGYRAPRQRLGVLLLGWAGRLVATEPRALWVGRLGGLPRRRPPSAARARVTVSSLVSVVVCRAVGAALDSWVVREEVRRVEVRVSVAVDKVDVLELVKVYRYFLKVYRHNLDKDNRAVKAAKVVVGGVDCVCLGVGGGVWRVVAWWVAALLPPRLPPRVTPRW